MPRKVIFLIDELSEWTGTEIHLFKLLQHLDRNQIQPVVGILGRAHLAEQFRARNLRVLELHINKVFSPQGLLGVGKITALLRREKAQLLVTYHTAADLLGPLAAKLYGIPVISCRRDTGFSKRRVHIRAQRWINHLIDGMISVSHAVAEAVNHLEGFPLERNQVIWNGEDLDSFSPGSSTLRQELGLDENIVVISTVSLLSPVKDHITQFAAMSEILKRDHHCCLLVVGDGPLRQRLRKEAFSLGQAIRFLGHRVDIPNILRASDIYLQTSTTEGFSNSIVQAMACGLPLVVTQVDGNVELVAAKCGFLVPVRAPSRVAEALSQLVENQEMRKQMGECSRERALSLLPFSKMVDAYSDALRRASDGRFPGLHSDAKTAT